MSLEQAIADLTAAVKANTLALQGEAGTDKPTPAQAAAPAATARPRGRPPGQAAASASTTLSAPPAPAAAAGGTPSAAQTVNGVSYADVKAAIMLLAQQKGHAAALSVLAQLGVTHGNQLKPEQWAPALSALQAAAGAAPIA